MADLDDFFAKKDKKKKGKKAFSKANTEVLAKNLEENDRKEQQAEEKANDVIQRGPRVIENQPGMTHEEADEWKEYEDTKLDYTNLKIDTLKIDEDPDPNDDGDDVNEDGEKVKKSKEGGPWSKLVASDSLDKPSDNEEKTPEPVPKEETPEPAPSAVAATKSSYVPPHLRNASSASANPVGGGGPTIGGPRGPRRPKHAPDISSEVYFPSLSAAMGTDDPAYRGTGQSNSNRGFEEVKSGGSQSSYNSRAAEAPKLSLDNKFAALRDWDANI